MDERYEVRAWFSSRAEDSCGRALVLPGAGYTVDHPALFWACQVLAQAGWRVATIRWPADGVVADALRSYAGLSLLIGGTADPMWSRPAVAAAVTSGH